MADGLANWLESLGRLGLIASPLEPIVAMAARKPVFDRTFVQKAGHVIDLPARAVAYDLPVPFGDLRGYEND